ncbi:MAG: ABC-F type ribosomal protection protein [Oscillibacter sp.]|nr:ABC-F type ribosomal protection protein [Oscillibacter sp.]
MSMIKVEGLTFSYPGAYDNIFENVSFQIDTAWKLGFTGRNGRGKTTFLNLLLQKYEYAGSIQSSVQFDYFPYPVPNKHRTASEILPEICPHAEEWELMRELSLLDVDPCALYRPFQTLSNGEQVKILLAALFLNEERFLLIDEPTNHLDSDARAIVSAYLRRKKGYILVSHDRRFLDGCVDHILSLNRADIQIQSGTFSAWLSGFEHRQAFEQAQNDRLQKDIKRLQQAAKRTAVWSNRIEASKTGAADKGYVGHKSAKMMKRAKSIEARQNQAAEQKAGLLKNRETAEDLKITPLPYFAETLAVLTEVSVCYDGTAANKPVSFTIRRGDRIALDGKNGSGKSSLLKLLLGVPAEHTGTIKLGSGLTVSYVPQDTSHLCGALSAFAEQHRLNESLFKAILRKMDFDRVQFEKDMADFSGGQKKKVLLAKSLCEPAHLYLWDEPLNFIDLYSRIQIERLLQAFSPTMVFVEHDAAFRENIATKTVRLSG